MYQLSLASFNGTESDNKYDFQQKVYVDDSGIVHCNVYTHGREGRGGMYRGWAHCIVIDTGQKVDRQIDSNWRTLLSNARFNSEQSPWQGGWYNPYLSGLE